VQLLRSVIACEDEKALGRKAREGGRMPVANNPQWSGWGFSGGTDINRRAQNEAQIAL